MLVVILRYLRGYLHIKITGYSLERFLNLCSHRQILLWNLVPMAHSYEMNISVSGFRKLKPLLKKTNTKVMILNRHGCGFFLHKYRKRKMFFAGILLCLAIIYTLTKFVWSIEISGNNRRTDEAVIQYLKTVDIYYGIRKSEIECEKIVKYIRKEYNDVIWVSAYVSGTRLIIDMKENTDSYLAFETKDCAPTNIISQSDGVITKIVTRKGIPQVHVGDRIQLEQMLISGQIPVINDSNEVVGYQYVKADADIYAKTMVDYNYRIDADYPMKEYSGVEKNLYFLKIGNFIFTLGDEKHDYKEYTQVMEQIPLCLAGKYELPISVGYSTIQHYHLTNKKYTEDEIIKKLNIQFQNYCKDLKKKKVEIIQNNVKIHIDEQASTATGTLELLEPVGEESPLSMIPLEQPANVGEERFMSWKGEIK
ncbi:MAG: sporulation protein YqfD [Lachnospiraceae bacterium]